MTSNKKRIALTLMLLCLIVFAALVALFAYLYDPEVHKGKEQALLDDGYYLVERFDGFPRPDVVRDMCPGNKSILTDSRFNQVKEPQSGEDVLLYCKASANN